MNMPFHSLREAKARFSAMERNAGATLVVFAALAAVGLALYRPGVFFALGSIVCGVLLFLCWRAALLQQYGRSAALACASASLAVGSAAAELPRPLPVLLLVGLALIGVGLYSSLFATKLRRNNVCREV